MLNRLLRLARCRIPCLHPDIEDLVAWAEECVAPRRSGQNDSTHIHVAGCSRCRAQGELIRQSLENAAPREPGDGDVLDEVLRDLQVRMRAWSSLSGMTSTQGVRRLGNPANRRLTLAVEMYFGREAASRIAAAANSLRSDQHLGPTVKPLFDAFLGVKAADALARRLAGTAV